MFFEIHWRKRRKHLTPLEINEYPVSSSAETYPSWLPSFKKTRNNTNRLTLEESLSVFPQTPEGFQAGFYPASGLATGFRVKRTVRNQVVPEINVYEPTSQQAALTAWLTHFEKTRNKTNRRYLDVKLDSYPQTDTQYYYGYYPASGPVTGFKVKHTQKLQSVPELNFYPLASVSAPLPAWEEKFVRTKNLTNHKLLNVELNEYPQSQFGYTFGYYPGSALAEGFKAKFNINRQELPELNRYALTTYPATLPAFETHFEKTKNHTNRYLLRNLPLDEYEEPAVITPAVPNQTFGVTSLIYGTKGINCTIKATQGHDSQLTITKGVDSLI